MGILEYDLNDMAKDGEVLELNEKLVKAKEIIEKLLKNAPDTYSGTNIELQQKKMFAFQNAVEQAYALLKE